MNKINKELDYMKFVHQFHNTMLDNQLTLVYEGEITQQLTKAFTSLAEERMDKAEEDAMVKRRVFHVMVECLQNVSKHADDLVTGDPIIPGSGIFMVGKCMDEYSITTGNVVANERREEIIKLLNKINGLNKEELKELYKKQIKESRLSDKGGAGLGFIDMVKKTGNKLNYHFEPINNLTSFFIISTKVTRAN